MRRRFDEIVEFSGVGKFIDTPVKRYSVGMYVRLAFAVAAHSRGRNTRGRRGRFRSAMPSSSRAASTVCPKLPTVAELSCSVSRNFAAVRALTRRSIARRAAALRSTGRSMTGSPSTPPRSANPATCAIGAGATIRPDLSKAPRPARGGDRSLYSRHAR